MGHVSAAAVTDIGGALLSIRGAVEVVRGGIARRVVIRTDEANRLLPAARALARSAGIDAHPAWSPGREECDIVIEVPAPADG
jgi:hypothetical protein